MRQVTGSNLNASQNKISVKLDAGGDLFVLEDVMSLLPPQTECGSTLCVELLTKRVMLMPANLLKKEEAKCGGTASVAQCELAKMGITLHQDEQVVSLGSGDVVALVVVPKSLINSIESRYGRDVVSFDVPLLRAAATSKSAHMAVDSHLGITVIKMFKLSSDGSGVELAFADIYDTPTDASVVYWVQRVALAMEVDPAAPLYIYRCSGTVRRLLLRNFKKILICE